jgi:hypothetical protein
MTDKTFSACTAHTIEEADMASKTAVITDKAQHSIEQMDWQRAIRELEKLFAISRDPHVRVRIGDVRRKLNRQREAIREYLFAAELFAEKGFVNKALAQCSLVLRLDASHADARSRIEQLRVRATYPSIPRGPREYIVPQDGIIAAQA